MSQTVTPSPIKPRIISDAERLAAYMQCEQAILLGHQSYTVDGMTFSRADLGKVQSMIVSLRQSVSKAQRQTVGGIVTTQVVF